MGLKSVASKVGQKAKAVGRNVVRGVIYGSQLGKPKKKK